MSEVLSPDDTKKYQLLLWALQWVIAMRSFDIGTAVMTLSSFSLPHVKDIYHKLRRLLVAYAKCDMGRYVSVQSCQTTHPFWWGTMTGNAQYMITYMKWYLQMYHSHWDQRLLWWHTGMPTSSMIWQVEIWYQVYCIFSIRPSSTTTPRNNL